MTEQYIEEKVQEINHLIQVNTTQSTNLFDVDSYKKLKGKVELTKTATGFLLHATSSTKYDGVCYNVEVEPSTQYTLQFNIPRFDGNNIGNTQYAITNAKGASTGYSITGSGDYSKTFVTGSAQSTITIHFYTAYRNSVQADLEVSDIMLTKGTGRTSYLSPKTFLDDVARFNANRALTEIDNLKAADAKVDVTLKNFEENISKFLLNRNEIPDIVTDKYEIKDGVTHILTGGPEKVRFNVLLNHVVKNDGFLTALNMGSNCYSSRIFVNGTQVKGLSDLYEYPVYKGDKVSIDITPRGPHYIFLAIGAKASNEFNFLQIEKGTCYISTSGSNLNTGTTPFNPRKTAPFGDRSFDTFKFKSGDVFDVSLDGAKGHITSYGTGNAIFDSLKEFSVTYDEANNEYLADLPALPGFIKYSEYETCWNMYGYEWPTKYAEYYTGKDIFGKDNSFYSVPQEDGTYKLHLKSSKKLTHIYAPTLTTGIRVRDDAVLDHLTIRNYSGFGINVYGCNGKIEIRDIYCEHIGGGFYSPNCRYGNGIQVNSDVSNCMIEDCTVHDCFDTGVTIQTNGGGYNNVIRRCKAWSCFWPFEAYWGNDVTFFNCVAYDSRDMSDGYRGVNASTRNSLFLVWAAGKLDTTRSTKFINCYGAYSTGDGIYVGPNVQKVIQDCKVYGTQKKSKNTVNTILKYEGNEVKYVEALAIGNLVTQK